MSLALYRKYRPATLAEVIGQDHVTAPLRQSLLSGRVHHAYLFSGPRGCGKTSTARILARSLNCENGPTPDPCGKCDSCVALAPNGPGSVDVVEIDAASHGLVEDARDLRERAFFTPAASRFKVYIVDEAHMVSPAGFNALLKLVEEPPAHVKFVFATTEPERVIATIRSRTFHYPFRLVPPGVLRDFLGDICEREGADVDPLVIPLVVRAGAGSVRDCLSLLDQLLAGSGSGRLEYNSAVALLGYTDAALLDEVVDAISAGDGGAVFRGIDALVEAGHDPRRFTADLLERFRDLVVLAAVAESAGDALLDVPADQAERMRTQAARFGPAELSRIADLLSAGLTEMRGATSPRLLLELLAARILLPGSAGEDLLPRIERLERRLAITGSVAPTQPASTVVPERPSLPERVTPAPPPAAPESPPATSPPAQMAGEVDTSTVRRVWPDVMEAVKRRGRTPAVLLADAQVVSVSADELVISFAHAALARRFADPAMSEVLGGALQEVLGVSRRVRAVHDAGRVEPEPDPAEDPVDLTDSTGSNLSPEEYAVNLVRDQLGAREVGEFETG